MDKNSRQSTIVLFKLRHSIGGILRANKGMVNKLVINYRYCYCGHYCPPPDFSFVRWEGLQLKDVGLVPGRYSIYRFLAGFVIGSFLAVLQPMLVMHDKPSDVGSFISKKGT